MTHSNDNITNIRSLQDLINDEYGNYYEVVGETTKGGKLTEVRISHAFYEIGFSRILSDELKEEYDHKHISVPIQDLLIGKIKYLEKKKRKIFSIQDLIDEGIEVRVTDILSEHPRGS